MPMYPGGDLLGLPGRLTEGEQYACEVDLTARSNSTGCSQVGDREEGVNLIKFIADRSTWPLPYVTWLCATGVKVE